MLIKMVCVNHIILLLEVNLQNISLSPYKPGCFKILIFHYINLSRACNAICSS